MDFSMVCVNQVAQSHRGPHLHCYYHIYAITVVSTTKIKTSECTDNYVAHITWEVKVANLTVPSGFHLYKSVDSISKHGTIMLIDMNIGGNPLQIYLAN